MSSKSKLWLVVTFVNMLTIVLSAILNGVINWIAVIAFVMSAGSFILSD